jgi:hypothetical protein
VNQFLGILGLAGFAVAVIGAAAFSTWLIVRLFPAPEDREAMRLAEEAKQGSAPPAAS